MPQRASGVQPRYWESEGGFFPEDHRSVASTNGHFLDDDNARRTIESGLDRLIISVDGTAQETYEQYRIGGKLELMLEGAPRRTQSALNNWSTFLSVLRGKFSVLCVFKFYHE